MDRGVPIRSLSRGIAVLKAINLNGSMTIMEICDTCAMPYATSSRIVQTLVFEGLIARDPGRKCYRATGLVRALAQGFQGSGRLATAARPHILDLTRRIGWPVSITTRIGPNMVVEESTHDHTTMAFSSPDPGYSLPVLECAAGIAYLSSLPEAQFQDVIAGLRAADLPNSKHVLDLITQDDLRRQVRAHGFATRSNVPFTRHPGRTSGIALPIFDGGEVIGAMTVIYFASAMRMAEAVNRLIPDLRRTARAIETSLLELPRP
jgi:IclR family mhp operon transcriptional activator